VIRGGKAIENQLEDENIDDSKKRRLFRGLQTAGRSGNKPEGGKRLQVDKGGGAILDAGGGRNGEKRRCTSKIKAVNKPPVGKSTESGAREKQNSFFGKVGVRNRALSNLSGEKRYGDMEMLK